MIFSKPSAPVCHRNLLSSRFNPAFTRAYCVFALLFALIALAAGCGGSSAPPPPPPPAFSVGKLYVTNSPSNGTDTLLRFNAGNTGNVAPEMTFDTSLQPGTQFLSLDVTHDRLAGFSLFANSIMIVDNVSSASCCAPPRFISGAATGLNRAFQGAIDSNRDVIYALNTDSTIVVLGPASTISGNVAPLRRLSTAASVGGIALDSVNDRLFLSDSAGNAILIFDNASTLNGTVTPSRTISGAATLLTSPGPLALDNSGRLVVASTQNPARIAVFSGAATANGNVAPLSTSTLATITFQIAVFGNGDLYSASGGSSVSAYTNIAGATGTLAPARTISGPNTGLNPPFPTALSGVIGIALDSTR
ncbi:MAG TPA: hypothetical protein VIB39_13075 [Candidatus Angelobacter sp.]|jgi:hypothetical protein